MRAVSTILLVSGRAQSGQEDTVHVASKPARLCRNSSSGSALHQEASHRERRHIQTKHRAPRHLPHLPDLQWPSGTVRHIWGCEGAKRLCAGSRPGANVGSCPPESAQPPSIQTTISALVPTQAFCQPPLISSPFLLCPRRQKETPPSAQVPKPSSLRHANTIVRYLLPPDTAFCDAGGAC